MVTPLGPVTPHVLMLHVSCICMYKWPKHTDCTHIRALLLLIELGHDFMPPLPVQWSGSKAPLITASAVAGKTVRNGSMHLHVTPQQSPQDSPERSTQPLDAPFGLSNTGSRTQPFDMFAAQRPSAEQPQRVGSAASNGSYNKSMGDKSRNKADGCTILGVCACSP